ncbi:MAG: DUF2065 domain-containing protein, partial [Hyphomicrobiales bacterium]|nr:DUF2065 domain-containing protein [Hyphomicrobiales bacterium]
LGLVLAIEGALYAAAPSSLKRMMIIALETPDGTLRTAGVVALALGVGVVWLVRG